MRYKESIFNGNFVYDYIIFIKTLTPISLGVSKAVIAQGLMGLISL